MVAAMGCEVQYNELFKHYLLVKAEGLSCTLLPTALTVLTCRVNTVEPLNC